MLWFDYKSTRLTSDFQELKNGLTYNQINMVHACVFVSTSATGRLLLASILSGDIHQAGWRADSEVRASFCGHLLREVDAARLPCCTSRIVSKFRGHCSNG